MVREWMDLSGGTDNDDAGRLILEEEGDVEDGAQMAQLNHFSFGGGKLSVSGVGKIDGLPRLHGGADVRMIGEVCVPQGLGEIRGKRRSSGSEVEGRPVNEVNGARFEAQDLRGALNSLLEHMAQVERGCQGPADFQQGGKLLGWQAGQIGILRRLPTFLHEI